MKTMHLFAGAGGGLLADLILGHDPIIAVEWDEYACKTLRNRAADGWFPNLSVWEGDVRLFDPSEYAGKVDCLAAGFPCQDISVAGKQEGLGEGTRSGLYREVLRVAGVVRPKYIFLENVSAILSNGLECVLGDLAALGYDCRWLCIRASDVGAPHGRDRWFALATMADTTSQGTNRYAKRKEPAYTMSGSCGENVADSISKRQQGQGESIPAIHPAKKETRQAVNVINGSQSIIGIIEPDMGLLANEFPAELVSGWWDIEPDVGRVTQPYKDRANQLKGLGNAQVPMQAAMAWKLLSNSC